MHLKSISHGAGASLTSLLKCWSVGCSLVLECSFKVKPPRQASIPSPTAEHQFPLQAYVTRCSRPGAPHVATVDGGWYCLASCTDVASGYWNGPLHYRRLDNLPCADKCTNHKSGKLPGKSARPLLGRPSRLSDNALKSRSDRRPAVNMESRNH